MGYQKRKSTPIHWRPQKSEMINGFLLKYWNAHEIEQESCKNQYLGTRTRLAVNARKQIDLRSSRPTYSHGEQDDDQSTDCANAPSITPTIRRLLLLLLILLPHHFRTTKNAKTLQENRGTPKPFKTLRHPRIKNPRKTRELGTTGSDGSLYLRNWVDERTPRWPNCIGRMTVSVFIRGGTGPNQSRVFLRGCWDGDAEEEEINGANEGRGRRFSWPLVEWLGECSASSLETVGRVGRSPDRNCTADPIGVLQERSFYRFGSCPEKGENAKGERTNEDLVAWRSEVLTFLTRSLGPEVGGSWERHSEELLLLIQEHRTYAWGPAAQAVQCPRCDYSKIPRHITWSANSILDFSI